MNKLKLSSLLLTTLLFSFNASAEMYKWVDKDGNISYSDQPPFKGAETLDAPSLSTIPAIKVKKKKKRTSPSASSPNVVTKYTFLKITSPNNETTFQNNGGTIPLSISSKPALSISQGHYISVALNGKSLTKKYSASSIQLSNIDRGTQKITVSIKNKQGKVLKKSSPITVFLHRRFIPPKQAR